MNRAWTGLALLAATAACSGSTASLPTALPADGGEGGAGDDVATDASADGDAGGDATTTADWVVSLDGTKAPRPLLPALLGQYELSGSLFHFDQVTPPLAPPMAAAGMRDWRVGVGRWEFETLLLPSLTDGTSCNVPAFAAAPQGTTDLQLIAARDWFTDDGNPVTPAAIADDSRYSLAYVRSVIDVAKSFGATPYVDVDHMPRAFAANRTPARTNANWPQACGCTWINAVSDVAPADAYVTQPLFAAAVVGLVKRVVEGSGAEPGRDAPYWEFWNEPELQYAWQQQYDPGLKKFFAVAVQVLVGLDQYRQQSGKALHFGLASFAEPETAAQVIAAFDGASTPPPVDFFSFHAEFSNDPNVVAARIQKVTDARAASKHYAGAELVLAEWAPDLNNPPDPTTMDLPLFEAAVVARAATLGVDRAHHAIFWDYYGLPGFSLPLLDHAVQPVPLYHAFELLAALIGAGADRLVVSGAPDGSLDGGGGAVIAAKDASGTRVLLVNAETRPRATAFVAGGTPATPSRVRLFDDPHAAVHDVTPTAVVTIPARSIALVSL